MTKTAPKMGKSTDNLQEEKNMRRNPLQEERFDIAMEYQSLS